MHQARVHEFAYLFGFNLAAAGTLVLELKSIAHVEVFGLQVHAAGPMTFEMGFSNQAMVNANRFDSALATGSPGNPDSFQCLTSPALTRSVSIGGSSPAAAGSGSLGSVSVWNLGGLINGGDYPTTPLPPFHLAPGKLLRVRSTTIGATTVEGILMFRELSSYQD